MTKKDYIKVAKLLKSLNVNFDNKDFTIKFDDIYNGLIDIFKNDNSKFDVIRFKDYIRKNN